MGYRVALLALQMAGGFPPAIALYIFYVHIKTINHFCQFLLSIREYHVFILAIKNDAQLLGVIARLGQFFDYHGCFAFYLELPNIHQTDSGSAFVEVCGTWR